MSVNAASGSFWITCPQHCTQYLLAELQALSFTIIEQGPAGVAIKGRFEDCVTLNHHLRTAHRVLWILDSFPAISPNDLYSRARKVDWENWLPVQGYFSVVSTVSNPSIRNTQFANQRLKDAIVDRIRNKTQRRPDSGPRTDRAVVFLYWHDDWVRIAIDTSGRSLSDRGYRQCSGKAPMRESLAAAVIMATKWNSGEAFVNPLCGSGTLAIEAAMMGASIPPGNVGRTYGYQYVIPGRDLEPISRVSPAQTAPVGAPIHASDIDAAMIRCTQDNARRAGVLHLIDLFQSDILEVVPPPPPGVVVVNPEYGIRLGTDEDAVTLHARIGDFFKQRCQGYRGYIFTGSEVASKKVGLRAARRMAFWSADIPCKLLEYEIYSGTKRTSFKTEPDIED